MRTNSSPPVLTAGRLSVREHQAADALPLLLSVVTPTYNEARRLGATLERLTSYLDEQSYSWELLVVDDGSSDDTLTIANTWVQKWPQIRVLPGAHNRGKGDAVRRGILAARGEFVLFSDADLSTPIEELERFLPLLREGWDVVIGSRALPDSNIVTPQPPLRRLMSKVFRQLTRRVGGTSVQDTQCGFKMFPTPVARHIFAQMHTDRFAFDVEILLLAEALGYRIKEVGVTWANNPDSTVSMLRDPYTMMRDIRRMRGSVVAHLADGLDFVPGPDELAISLITLQQVAGQDTLPLADLIRAAHRISDTVVIDAAPAGLILAVIGVPASQSTDVARRLADAASTTLAAHGYSNSVAHVVRSVPIATPASALAQYAAPLSTVSGAQPISMFAKLQVEADVRATDERVLAAHRDVWKRRRRVVHALTVLNIFGLVWWLDWLLNFSNAVNLPLYTALVLAECFSIVQVLGYWYTVWHDREPDLRRGRIPGKVDVFIPTYNEPVSVVERTVRAALAMPYPHRTYVLDDGKRPEIAALARELGAIWITRPDNRGAKAGNINHALSVTDGDYFAVFDADHAPHPDFLQRLMPYLADDKLAFVQTPQYYRNRHRTYVASAAMDQQEIFFGPICRGKDGLGAVFCCGTNMVMRRAAIADVGGFHEDSIVEDAVTSLHLHEQGWKSRYISERLAEGLAPEDLDAYLSQQRRWARGNLEMLLRMRILRRHMPLRLRLQYFWSAMYYLSALPALVYLTLPLLFLLFGTETVSARASDFIAHFLPYIFITVFILARSAEGHLRFRAIQLSYGLFPVFLGALWSIVSGRSGHFVVTSKVRRTESFYHLVVPQIVVITITVLALIVGFVHFSGARTITNSSWAIFNIIMLSAIVRAAAAQRAPAATSGRVSAARSGSSDETAA